MLREAGEIDELSRGVYRHADAEPTAHLDLLAVCTRAPHAVVCGESALSLHELIDDIRAVVDAMRLGRAEGRSLALSALNRYLHRTGQQGVADLQRAARELGGMPAIRPAIEAVLA
jgi:hypothetical protein